MKVFDFTNGTKGKLLANVKVTGYARGWLERSVSGKVYQITVTGGYSVEGVQVEWTSGAGYTEYETGADHPYKPEDFGVEAITYCTGQFSTGLDKGTWHWEVIGTQEWNRAALKSGILTATLHT